MDKCLHFPIEFENRPKSVTFLRSSNLTIHNPLSVSTEQELAIMSKPQWKIDQENKERVIKEREEAEKKAKQEKLSTLGNTSSDAASPAPSPASTAVR